MITTQRAIVLGSGGLDSAVCTGYAVDQYGAENVVSVSLFYGQRHKKELECANKLAEHYGLKHIEYDISSAMEHTKAVSSLIEGSEIAISDKSYADQIAEEGRPLTEIPLRNGIFLMFAGSIAMSLFPNEEVAVIYGAHADDAAGNAYPDCTPEFAGTTSEAISIGSRDLVHVERPLIHLNKAGVVALGLQLKVPFDKTWSCYNGGEHACGTHCATCLDRVNAFKENGVIDPITYAESIDWSGCEKIDYLIDKYPEE